MSEIGDDFKALREFNKEKKANNFESSVQKLVGEGIPFQQLSNTHLRIGEFDFWPSTGLFIHRKTGKRGRGVFNLIKRVKP